MKLLIPLSMLVLLTGCITSSSLKNEISILRTHSNASTTNANVTNKARKRSFDFPTIFYPGPDNRYITLSPLPRFPHNFEDGASTPRSRLGPKKNHRVQPIDFTKLQSITETSAQNNFPPPLNQINDGSFRRVPLERPRFDFDEERNFVDKPPVILTTLAPAIRKHPSTRPDSNRTFKQRFNSRTHKQKQADVFPVTTFRPQFIHTSAPNFSPGSSPVKASSMIEVKSSFISHARPEKNHFHSQEEIQRRPQNNHRDFEKVELIPQTNFVCRPKMNGYFADFETGCQTFHICHDKRRYSFRCPTGTRFSQSILVCDWEYRVKCS